MADSRSTGYLKWLTLGTGVAAAGAAGYLAYRYAFPSLKDAKDTKDSNNEEGDTIVAVSSSAVNPLKIVRQIQLHTYATPASTFPSASSPAPKAAKSKGPSLATKPAGAGPAACSNNRKLCAHCRQPLAGLPLRCSNCKSTYYCSAECQRKAWPDHKQTCKPSKAAPAKPAATAASMSTAAEFTSPAPLVISSTDVSTSTEASSNVTEPAPKSMEEALAQALAQSSLSKSDELEALFETAVMHFLRGEYRLALPQFNRVQMMARDRKDAAIEGEIYKWLGHCHNKLADAKRAEEWFTDGILFAKAAALPKLEIDCLGGLGMMHRALNQPTKAVEYLEKALEITERTGDQENKASMLCNLGAAMMQLDQTKALHHLQEAVQLREEAIARCGEAGDHTALATAVIEHANAMVNLGSALYVMKNIAEARPAYERALEVFEMMEDVDKVSKVLVNLANMSELQLKEDPNAKKQAAGYRKRLNQFLSEHGQRTLQAECPVCLESLPITKASTEGSELIILACYHPLHDKCWQKWIEQQQQQIETGPSCPTCKLPIPLFDV